MGRGRRCLDRLARRDPDDEHFETDLCGSDGRSWLAPPLLTRGSAGVLGANDTIGIGLIGVGNRGSVCSRTCCKFRA